jgi:tetratricopeptide (TPR) repeat protein
VQHDHLKEEMGGSEHGPDNPILSRFGISPRNLAALFVVMTLLFAATEYLSRAYRSERGMRARRYFETGRALAAKGQPDEAIEQYRRALAIDRASRQYRLALALALVELGRVNEAQNHLNELLQADPTHGVANRMLARIAAQQGRTEAAITYYHRAIYGYWPERPDENRTEARFELVDLLGKTGARKQAVAQLLQLLDAVAEKDLEAKSRIGRQFLEYGAPTQASEVFRDILRSERQNAAASAGYGEAEFQLGNYRAAQSALRRAIRANADDTSARSRLELVDQILTMDPTLRGLGAAEQHRRSREVLQSTVKAVEQCFASQDAQPSLPVQEQLEAARKVLAATRRPPNYNSAVEANLSLAEQLWEVRMKLCGPVRGSETALARVIAGLSR